MLNSTLYKGKYDKLNQNKDGTIILRIEPKLKFKFNKKCKKMNYKMSEVIVAFINEYVGQE